MSCSEASRMLPPVHGIGLQRRAAFDRAVGLDAQRRAAGAARAHVPARDRARAAPLRTGRSSRCCFPASNTTPASSQRRLSRASSGKQLQQLVGLQQHLGRVGGAPHRHGQLICQACAPSPMTVSRHVGQLRHRQPVDLRVHRHADAGVAQVAGRVQRAPVEPATPRRRSCVASSPSIETLALCRPAPPRPRARSASSPRPPVVIVHCMPAARMARDDLQPVVAQVGLAADERSPRARRARPSAATRSRHSAVDSSSGRARPAREPQCRQARSHFSVISQTA